MRARLQPNALMTQAVPNIAVASGPVLALESRFLDAQQSIEAWLRREWAQTTAPFYCSVDLRNAGFKLAPVDTNLFPAGFNNLNPNFDTLCLQALQTAVERTCPTAAKLVLVPENHTRNRFYMESVARLKGLLERAGFEIRVGSISPEITEPTSLELDSGATLTLEPLERSGDRLHIGRFSPCAVVLNNDLSGGVPDILRNVVQPLLPPAEVSWAQRLKSQHFAHYREVTREFAEHIGIDPWLITPGFRNCGNVNFLKREGEDCLAANVEGLLEEIRAKYAEYGITNDPFVVVKADAGTYGMGVMTAKHPDELRQLNRNMRKKMASAKGGGEVTGAIIQEGVYTFETIGEPAAVAEPVVYMIDHHVVGGFYRVHEGRGNDENLNAPGARFHQLAFADPGVAPDSTCPPDDTPNRFYAYGVVARLAMLAAAREIRSTAHEAAA